jgi:ABC-type Fe3+-hydroxamate transport system substrate-binding protein
MISIKTLPILMTAALAFVGCNREPETTTKTTTETKQVGSTAESTSETKVDTPSGETKTVTNRYVGTVTEFKPGKSIEVMTGNKDSHAFELDGKNDVVAIDRATVVGSKVLLVEEKGEKGFHRITVTIAPAA